MTFIEILKKRWYIVTTIGLILLLVIVLGGSTLFVKESFATLRLHKINASAIQPGEKIIVVNESDFRDIPKLASILLNSDQNSKESYSILFSEEEYLTFKGRFWSNITIEDRPKYTRIIEYNGRYFEYDYPQIH